MIVGLTTGLLVMLAIARFADLWWWRSNLLESADARGANLAVILSEYVRETFATYDASLRQLTIYGRHIGGAEATDDDWTPILQAARAGLAGVGSLSVIDSAGTIRHTTQPLIKGQSRRDEYLFDRLAASSGDGLIADRPFLTISQPREILIPVGRRLTKQDGTFDGIVVATFNPNDLRRFFRSVNVGRQGMVWAFHPDGIVFFREPSGGTANPIGESAQGNAIFEAARRAANGRLRGPAAPEGPVVRTSFHKLDAPPAIVAVSLAESEILEEWWREMGASVLFFAVVGSMLAATLFVLLPRIESAHKQVKALFAANPLPMWVHDAATLKILEVNDAAVSGYGYSRSEFLAMRISDIQHKADTRSDVPAGTMSGSRHRIKSGRFIDVDVTSHALTYQGRPAELVVAQDVSERRQLEAQLRQVQKMEAVGQLAGGIAHDFNNLLTAILGYSNLLLEEPGAGEQVRRDVEEIRKAAESAASLTGQLLAFSRRQILEPQILDLTQVISRMDSLLRRLISEDVQLVSRLAPSLYPVSADPGQIEQIVVNLAVNARDAMPRGGQLTIETANVELDGSYVLEHPGASAGRHAMVAVSDTGVGMDAATQARIFEPFFTTKPRGKGTGLGLATVYGIVKQSGGWIWAYSEPGHGTTFKVYFPAASEDAAREIAAAHEGTIDGTETILLTEDQPEVESIARAILGRHGYTVLSAASGEEALRTLEGDVRPIHLLLTDVVMPSMSGPELASRVQSTYPEVAVLYMSGYTDDAIVRHGVLAAGVAFIQKPFTPEGLLRKIRDVLDAPRPVSSASPSQASRPS
jgi:two-component system, cell cycle sensor histidine kinase and response regulator CckA